MLLTIVESPYAAGVNAAIQANITYARAALADCLTRGEAPYASHLLYTQPGVLRDHMQAERDAGIAAGFAWGEQADLRAFYIDRGFSRGMVQGLHEAMRLNQHVRIRTLPEWAASTTRMAALRELNRWLELHAPSFVIEWEGF